jgi:hypothetical protein
MSVDSWVASIFPDLYVFVIIFSSGLRSFLIFWVEFFQVVPDIIILNPSSIIFIFLSIFDCWFQLCELEIGLSFVLFFLKNLRYFLDFSKPSHLYLPSTVDLFLLEIISLGFSIAQRLLMLSFQVEPTFYAQIYSMWGL